MILISNNLYDTSNLIKNLKKMHIFLNSYFLILLNDNI